MNYAICDAQRSVHYVICNAQLIAYNIIIMNYAICNEQLIDKQHHQREQCYL